MPTLRILGGTAKGRALQVPDSARPTGARLRKSLFDLLDSRQGAGRFLDLYGGSGAVGLEAASRGYDVTLVERNPAAVRILERNARLLSLPVHVVSGEALGVLSRLGAFDTVFVDPPYLQDIQRAASSVLKSGAVLAGGLLIVQHPTQLTLGEHEGYTLERRVYGSNVMTLYTRLE
ncbi:RsmD family RNA methyltransferase [Deinococcus peraridilitoris]|uniref:RsmD family RNA methyltransferase n=1 Tax=Deinococcus peraridilitoris TaxID=432329 RepID=UPI0012FB90AB|nr:RsmD family RNA methyltransferase [Deinococcus peraridilitoris]